MSQPRAYGSSSNKLASQVVFQDDVSSMPSRDQNGKHAQAEHGGYQPSPQQQQQQHTEGPTENGSLRNSASGALRTSDTRIAGMAELLAEAVETVRTTLTEADGAHAIVCLLRRFREAGKATDRGLSYEEFKAVAGAGFRERTLHAIFRVADPACTGYLQEAALLTLLVPPLAPLRRQLAEEAVQAVQDQCCPSGGQPTLGAVLQCFDAKAFAEAAAGPEGRGRTSPQAVQDVVGFCQRSLQEGVDSALLLQYFRCLSAAVDSDVRFAAIMRRSWQLQPSILEHAMWSSPLPSPNPHTSPTPSPTYPPHPPSSGGRPPLPHHPSYPAAALASPTHTPPTRSRTPTTHTSISPVRRPPAYVAVFSPPRRAPPAPRSASPLRSYHTLRAPSPPTRYRTHSPYSASNDSSADGAAAGTAAGVRTTGFTSPSHRLRSKTMTLSSIHFG